MGYYLIFYLSSSSSAVWACKDICHIFLDAIQIALNVANPQECALTVLATVTSRPTHDRAVVDAGSKVFAIDKGAYEKEMLKGFGLVLNKKAVRPVCNVNDG